LEFKQESEYKMFLQSEWSRSTFNQSRSAVRVKNFRLRIPLPVSSKFSVLRNCWLHSHTIAHAQN